MNNFVDGILLADKPRDWTSHDVCAFVRKRFNIKKVGHAGTLDPLATGLLVLLLGSATKQSNTLSSNDKEYEGVMELGAKTDSHDFGGKVTANAPWEHITLEQVAEGVKKFTGEITQVPPMVSALKHQGRRLYELARKGVEVHRDPRPIRVYEFNIQKKEGPHIWFSVKVSKGTYVRTLVNDLGEVLGCLAFLKELRRVRSGDFKLEDGVTIEELRNSTLQEIRKKVFAIRSHDAALHKD